LNKISEGLDVAFKRVRKNINTPGFRKGKMPRQIFNKMYGEEALYQEALNDLLPEAYSNAVKEADINPVDQPQIDVESMESDAA
ncbi:trigger factor family protein, partial [Staphylococcus epidermidis]